MEEIKKKIFQILMENQETCKVGSDGDYEQMLCVFYEDFDVVADEITSFIQSVFDLENQPNQFGIKNPFQQKLTFEKAVEPAIRYLFENHHPHTKIHIDYSVAELLEGKKSHNLNDEVPD